MSENIVADVAGMLSRDDLSAANRFSRSFKCDSIDPSRQILELNRFWRDQLSQLHISTISARTCLVDDIAPRDWLRHFGQLVLPVIIKHNLPTGN